MNRRLFQQLGQWVFCRSPRSTVQLNGFAKILSCGSQRAALGCHGDIKPTGNVPFPLALEDCMDASIPSRPTDINAEVAPRQRNEGDENGEKLERACRVAIGMAAGAVIQAA
jgi:hypothetical protein